MDKETQKQLIIEIMNEDAKDGLYKKQTAVEWLYNHLFPNQLDGFSYDEWDKIDKAFEQAKEMEKQQIIKAWDDGDYAYFSSKETGIDFENGEQYYNEEYGGNNEQQ